MSKTRNFDEEFSLDGEGLTFTLGGQEFRTKTVAPPAAFMDRMDGLDGVIGFLSQVIVPEDRDRFLELVKNPDAMMSIYQLDSLAAWVIEETSGRPTKSPD